MIISLESPNTVKLIPEKSHEKESLEALWKTIIRCNEDSKTLCPVGSYMASKNKGATFVIQNGNTG